MPSATSNACVDTRARSSTRGAFTPCPRNPIHRSRFRPVSFCRVSACPTHPQPGGHALVFDGKAPGYATFATLIGGVANRKQITRHWDDILRPATSIKHGSVTASLILRKLSAYPRQNGLAVALRELGRIDRTLFLLQYISGVEFTAAHPRRAR